MINSALRDIKADRVEYFSEAREKMLSNVAYADDTDYNISIIRRNRASDVSSFCFINDTEKLAKNEMTNDSMILTI